MSERIYTMGRVWAVLCLWVWLFPPHAQAEVLQIDATLSAEIQEFIDGKVGSIDSAFEEFGATSTTLPLQVVAQLRPPEDAPSNGFVAEVFADFRDPAASPTRNPSELGFETHAYSGEPDLSFEGHAVATETRKVVFTAEELSLAEGETEQRVGSGVFVSGAAIIWSQEQARDLSGLSIALDVFVEQHRPGMEPLVVFQASLTVQGISEGRVILDSPDGIFARLGGPDLLSAAPGFTDLQLLEELAALGRLHLVIIPMQELPYFYTAAAGEEFDLAATFEVRAANLPDRTGVGTVFGRSFAGLARAVRGSVRGTTQGVATQAAVNAALAETQAGVPHPFQGWGTEGVAHPFQGWGTERGDAISMAPSSGLCGAVGAGTLAMTFALMLGAGRVRRLG